MVGKKQNDSLIVQNKGVERKKNIFDGEIQYLSLNQLVDFKNHPFKVEMNTELFEMMQSIEKEGVMMLLLAKQEKRTVIIADGAYSGTENIQLAADKNIGLITASLTGKPAPDILADFEFNGDGTKALRCPAGHAPKSCSYRKQSNQCAVSFLHDQCVGCLYQEQCKPKVFKRVAKIVTSKAAHEREKIQRDMSSGESKNYARLRNGVETVLSNIRRNYHKAGIPIIYSQNPGDILQNMNFSRYYKE